uniref:non-specific serine/threonine protein kinase n=1 Tax=Esox lucius TaxID=8010 RepID=A0AAY5K7F1_ESOLU
MKGRYSHEVVNKIQKLSIKNLKPEDQGCYTCRYDNLESTADLWVEAEQIHFTKRIQNIVVGERQAATFECEVSFDNAIVTWYKDTWELKECPKYNFRSEGRRHFMIIRNVTSDDEGVYSVIVRLEPRGEAKSTAELYLSGKEIELARVPHDVPDSSIQMPDMPSSVTLKESSPYYYEEEMQMREVEMREYEIWTEEKVVQKISTTTAPKVPVEESVQSIKVGMREEMPQKVSEAFKKPEEKAKPAVAASPYEAKRPVDEKITARVVPEEIPSPKEEHKEAMKPVHKPAEKPEQKVSVLPEDVPHVPEPKPEPKVLPAAKLEPEPKVSPIKKPESLPSKVPEAAKKPEASLPELEKPARVKKPETPSTVFPMEREPSPAAKILPSPEVPEAQKKQEVSLQQPATIPQKMDKQDIKPQMQPVPEKVDKQERKPERAKATRESESVILTEKKDTPEKVMEPKQKHLPVEKVPEKKPSGKVPVTKPIKDMDDEKDVLTSEIEVMPPRKEALHDTAKKKETVPQPEELLVNKLPKPGTTTIAQEIKLTTPKMSSSEYKPKKVIAEEVVKSAPMPTEPLDIQVVKPQFKPEMKPEIATEPMTKPEKTAIADDVTKKVPVTEKESPLKLAESLAKKVPKPAKTLFAEEVEASLKPAEPLLKKVSLPEFKSDLKSEPKPEKAVAELPKPAEPLVKKLFKPEPKPEKKAVAEGVSLSSEDVSPQKVSVKEKETSQKPTELLAKKALQDKKKTTEVTKPATQEQEQKVIEPGEGKQAPGPAKKVLRQKAKIHLEEEETLVVPTLKKTTRISKAVEQEQEIVALKKVPSVPVEEMPAVPKKPPPKIMKHTIHDFKERQYEEGEVPIIENYEAEQKAPKETESKEDKWFCTPIPTDETEDEIITLKQAPKDMKEDTPTDPSLVKKKVSRLPSDEKQEETVKLKPFQKFAKVGTVEPEKDKDKVKEFVAAKIGERHPKDEHIKAPFDHKKADKVHSPTEEPQAIKLKPLAKDSEDVQDLEKPLIKAKRIPTQEEEKKEVKLKPIATSPKETYEAVKPEKKEEKITQIKPSPPKTTPIKKMEKSPPVESPVQLKKVEHVPKEPEDKEKDTPLKHEDTLKRRVELKKTPSPKVEKPKPKEIEKIVMERKPSAERTKKLPKEVSPKVSVESVTLKKVPKKSPQEETDVTPPKKVPAIKELSPKVVQLRKISTQLEEEVFEEEPEVEEESDNEEWGWELVPRDSPASTEDWGEEGDALETPGMLRRDGKPAEEVGEGRGRGRGLRAGKTPSPGEGRGRGLRPGGGGDKPPDANPFGFQLKAVPLKFTKPLKDIVLQEGDAVGASATFECEVSPSTAVTTWMKDGSNLRESPKHKFTSDGKDRKLAIIDVQLVDTGEYTCVAKLGNKEKTTTAKLIVEELPVKWVKELEEETSVLKGQPMYLTCELNKEREVTWMKNGKVLKVIPGKVAINVIGMQQAITIQNTENDDAGIYACECELIRTKTTVKVIEIIRDWLVKPLRDQHVKPKAAATFKCELFKETPNWKWFKGDEEITNDPTDKTEVKKEGKVLTLTVKNAQPDDIAEYSMEVEGQRYSAKLTLAEREAEILKPLSSMEVVEKEDVTFETEISEDDVPGEWKHKGQVLTRSPTCVITMEGNKRFLTLKNVPLEASGEVSYTALNAVTSAVLTVKDGKPYFTTKLHDYSVTEKDELVMVCELSKPNAEVKWFKGNQQITTSKNVVIKADGKRRMLIIKKTEKANIGEYTCDCVSDKTTANVNIEERDIKVVKPLYSVEVTETEIAKFETEISEDDVHGHWKLKGEALHQSPDCEIKEEGTRHVMILYNVRKDQAGEVDFQAANAKSSAHLRVKARVIGLLRPLNDVTVTAGETATFECELSYEGIDVEWFLGGTKLEPSERVVTRAEGKTHTLTLRDVKISEAGEVKLTAKDFQTDARLHVNEPPVEFTKPLEDQTVEEEATAILECEVSRENAEVLWFQDSQEIRKTKKYDIVAEGCKRRLIIHGCTLDDSKTYTCDASEFKTSCFLNV